MNLNKKNIVILGVVILIALPIVYILTHSGFPTHEENVHTVQVSMYNKTNESVEIIIDKLLEEDATPPSLSLIIVTLYKAEIDSDHYEKIEISNLSQPTQNLIIFVDSDDSGTLTINDKFIIKTESNKKYMLDTGTYLELAASRTKWTT